MASSAVDSGKDMGSPGLSRIPLSPASSLSGIAALPGNAAGASLVLAPTWHDSGLVQPGILQVLLDAALTTAATAGLASDEDIVTGQMHTTFVPGSAAIGLVLSCSGRLIATHGSARVAVGDLIDESGAVLAHGVLRSHAINRSGLEFLEADGGSVWGTALEDVFTLEVLSETSESMSLVWPTDLRAANRQSNIHGGFVSTLSELASRTLAGRRGEVRPLDHTHRYYRPLVAAEGQPVRCEVSVERAGRQVINTSCSLLDIEDRVLGSSSSSYAVVG